jgi:hypothetical protein
MTAFDSNSMYICTRSGTIEDDDGTMLGVVAGSTRFSSVILSRIAPEDAEAHFDIGVRSKRFTGSRSEIRFTGRDGRMHAAEPEDFQPRR